MSQQELPGFNQEPGTSNQGPVTCLGMTFPNDEERRKQGPARRDPLHRCTQDGQHD